jgi:hypothetical protein
MTMGLLMIGSGFMAGAGFVGASSFLSRLAVDPNPLKPKINISKYRISSYSFSKNYSFLSLKIVAKFWVFNVTFLGKKSTESFQIFFIEEYKIKRTNLINNTFCL